MINNTDKEILKRIGFSEKFLKKNSKYVKKKESVPLFKKADIISIFKNLEHDFKYIKGGAYVISKTIDDYKFELSFVISYNVPLIYLYVYKDDEILNRGINNFSYTLNHIEYDNRLLNNDFGLNSIEDLGNYIIDMIEIFNSYINEFMNDNERQKAII